MAKNFGIIKAPDGFYIGSILKTGMLSADSRKITDDEIAFMFEDMMRRHKAETGEKVRTFFHAHEPVMIAKVDPSLEECGIMTPRMKAMLAARAKQMAALRRPARPQGLRLAVPKVQN
jgi:hypothetical protein